MIEIPSQIRTLLKSKMMVGANRPTGYIEIGGMPGNQNLLDPYVWSAWRDFGGAGRLDGNMCETADGRAIISYCEGNAVKIAYSPTVAGIIDGTATFDFANAVTIFNSADVSKSLGAKISLIDGKLNMTISYHNSTTNKCPAEFWRDEDGNGTGFAYVSTVTPEYRPNTYFGNSPRGIHTYVNKVGKDKLAVGISWWNVLECYTLFYSSNNGLTWTQGTIRSYGAYASNSFLVLGEGEFLVAVTEDTGSSFLLRHTNGGASCEKLYWSKWYDESPQSAPWMPALIEVGKKIYMVYYHDGTGHLLLVEFLPETLTMANVVLKDSWSDVVSIPCDTMPDSESGFVVCKDALILQHVNYSSHTISGAGTEVISQKLQPKSITVDRSKGSASQATVVLDNKGGQHSPDPAGPWNHVIWPNNTIQIQLGYGQYLPQVFTGMIDDVDMGTPPAMINVTARDNTKLALDQICQWTWDGITYYDGAFAAQDPEGIFLALATMAGWAAEDVIVEASGIIIPEFKFNQQTYGDLFQSLAEKAGFEWFEEENTGKLRFRPVTYPENPTPAYEFTHGVDIFSLRYKISDAEIYRTVVVTAQGEDETTVSASAVWSAADYYGLPAHKTLLVTAGDMVNTEAGCLEIAQRLCTAMNSKPRQVQFVAVGMPNLQLGDCIKVTEASSTISEIYRVFDFEHQFDAEGQPVFATAINCYWYAHG